MSPRRAVTLSRAELRALGVARVVPHRPRTLGPNAVLAIATKPKRRDDEHAMQVAYFAWLDTGCDGLHPDIGLDAFAVPNAARRSLRQGARMKAEGMRAGVPDVCIDAAHGGWFGARVEFKTATGTTSPAQKERLKRLLSQNYYAVVARSLVEAQELTLNYLARPRTQVMSL
jgi:hypothetical protein